MVRITFWLQLLLLVFILRQSNELQNEASSAELEPLQECIEENLSLRSQIDEIEIDLNSNIEVEEQMQAKTECLTKAVNANNRTIQELQATVDAQKKTIDEMSQTVKLLQKKKEYACRYLFAAIESGDVNTVKILLKSAKESCITDDEVHYTPLMFAAYKGRVDLVRLFLESGASVEITNEKLWTPLHVAAYHGQLEVCRLFLDWGAQVNPVSKRKGNIPLHSAARRGHLSVVKLLVERGANIRLRNRDGLTAGDVARIKGYGFVADWLKKQFSG